MVNQLKSANMHISELYFEGAGRYELEMRLRSAP